MQGGKRNFCDADKRAILASYDSLPKMSQRQASKALGISQSCLQRYYIYLCELMYVSLSLTVQERQGN